MRKPGSRKLLVFLVGSVLLALAGCLPTPPSETGDLNITVYGFSIMKESLEKGVFPGFAAKWKQTHGQEVRFTSSFAGSETITNQILQGVNADIAILSIERDVLRLKEKPSQSSRHDRSRLRFPRHCAYATAYSSY
jgi:ABC-type sulfate transport system substrate-binding protein